MTTDISAKTVQTLREKTGVSLMECKRALVETQGSLEKATELLRKKGIDTAASKSGRAAKEGRVYSYIHHNNKVGAMIEVDCESDFVARNPEFEGFVRDLCMQIVAARPKYVSREQVPADIVAKEKEIYAESDQVKGKPANVVEKIVSGKLDKFYEGVCLLEQKLLMKEGNPAVQEIQKALIVKLGENIIVRRFACFEVGEGQ